MWKNPVKVLGGLFVYVAIVAVVGTGLVVQGIGGIKKKVSQEIRALIQKGENPNKIARVAKREGLDVSIEEA